MTISSTVRTAGPYTGTGSVNTYPFAFKVFQASNLLAQQTDTSGNITTLVLTTNYSVTLNADQNASPGGSIVLNSNLPSGYKLILSSQVPELQGTSITNNGGFYPQVVENALDYLTILTQQLQTELTQCMQLPLAVQGVATTLPAPVGGSLLGWNATGTALVNVGASGIGAGSVMDVNVAANAAIQASKLQFTAPGTGGVARTVQARMQETISVMDYGATGNGVTDDTAAIQAALNEAATTGGPRRVYFPMGTYVVSSGFTINHPLRLVGEGPGAAAFEGAPAENGTRIKYTGSSGATLFAFTNVNFGNGGIEGMWLDCNGLAANGLVLDGCMSGRFTDVTVGNFTVCGLKLTGTTTTCSWNTFTNMVFESGTQTSGTKAAIWLSGVVGGSNACHNSFITTKMDIAGSFHGIYLGGCDNNSFLMTYIFRSSGATGNGVYVDPTEMTNFPINNTFFHLQASVGGWYQPSSTASLPAKIVGYMMDNGQPLPSLNLNGSTAFDCVDTTFPVTVAAGTGWSGGTPTFQAWYRIDSRHIFLTILITGTAVVAAANATITGIPPNTGNQRGLAVGSGVNVGGSAQPVYGYISGSTLTVQSGITSTSSAQMTFVYEI